MGQFWTKLVVIVHKIARFRTRKPNNTLSALKSIHRKNNNFGCIIRKSKFPQNPKRSVRFSGKRTKRSVQKRKARNTQKAETKVL